MCVCVCMCETSRNRGTQMSLQTKQEGGYIYMYQLQKHARTPTRQKNGNGFILGSICEFVVGSIPSTLASLFVVKDIKRRSASACQHVELSDFCVPKRVGQNPSSPSKQIGGIPARWATSAWATVAAATIEPRVEGPFE